ncbi:MULTISPECIES: phage baseplate assembly protein [Pasteurellaceae]|uniref:phage baseplate assembly protein n=1 Tax=Pasteurellaceae TaxID=712 RepID=UPI001240DD0D|nr:MULTISPECIES: phage tail protein [Pasteurellaceae]MCW9698207.1 phage tail protein [Avibacterium sp. 20-129]
MSASGLKVEVADSTVTRYRPMVIIADDNMTGTSGYQRADWERKRRNAEGSKATAQVRGWFKPDGTLWQPNDLIVLDAPLFGINKVERLIIDCTYTLDDGGMLTVMTLMHRDAFDEPADETLDDVDSTSGKKSQKSSKKKAKSKKAKKSDKDNVAEFTGFVD